MTVNNHRDRIKKLILDSEDYPTVQDVIDHCNDMEGYEFVEFFQEMLKMQDEGIILYDGKHDAWLWTEPSEKMKEILKNAVRL